MVDHQFRRSGAEGGRLMRFLLRALLGAVIIGALCIGLIMFGLSKISAARQGGEGGWSRPAVERAYVVRTETLKPQSIAPTLSAFGELRAWREVELRAGAAGRIVDVSPDFLDGAMVEAGEILLRIDPTNVESARDDALSRLADARAEESDARQAVRLAEADLNAARQQLDLQRGALERQQNLLSRGYAARASVDAAQGSFNSASQGVFSREQALLAAQKRVELNAQAVARAQRAVDESGRNVGDTVVKAPFDGALDEVMATRGRLVSLNESLGRLIDLSSLEARFTVSDSQFARLIDESGALRALPVTARVDLGPRAITAKGALDRAAPRLESSGSGRALYARLDTTGAQAMRPGDRATILVDEPLLENVARIPARAASEDGRILLLGDDGRLEEAQVEIVRREAESLIIRDAPFGARYVIERLPQLGPGVKARDSNDPEPERPSRGGRPGGGRPGGGEGGGRPGGGESENEGGEMIALDEERRAKLIAFVEANQRMPEARRAQLLEALRAEKTPAAMVERLEGRMQGGGGRRGG